MGQAALALHKRCGKCKLLKVYEEFGLVKGELRSYCRACHRAQIDTPDLRTHKQCSCCREVKIISEFNRQGVRYYSLCKDCQNERQGLTRVKQKDSGENIKINRKDYWQRRKWINIKSKYGLTKEQYLTMVKAQNNLCAICNKPETESSSPHIKEMELSIDHDHKTGIVRGLLCRQCNIGKLGESPERLRRAADYIERNGK